MLNKKGISTIVTVIILVALVLVVIGIFWGTAIGVVEEQTEGVDYSQKCLGIVFKINDVDCDGSECNVSIERSIGSSANPVDGIEVTVGDGTNTADATTGDVAVSKTVTISTAIDATEANLRIFFNKEDDSKHYCATPVTWTA